ncbi:Up-regulated during septation-domain-containing protein [Suillus subalutaceus]|uniref:Up-regulated during septation-domain-containing protein n=1 Tax=Suillus subalutaceus TaxID=48586 RepID=UPI001B85F27C|nr:Up-regulated during septation-domain-containing protein [Suillus subalutaceus]KAG1873560.1 Up-regulated during septation-domain-containing protein [Suillus subalutaceus]
MNGVRKLWGGGSPSTSSPTTQTPGPATPITPISPAPSAAPSSESSPLTTTPGLFIKKNKKQSSVATVSDAGNGNDVNGSDRSASPASSRVTSPLRKPVPAPIPVPGPSSPRILPPLKPRASTASEWKRTSGLLNIRDDLLMSLLTSEAVVESRECEILSGEEVEELKKEHQILKIRLAAAQRKLKLETKIRDAALSLSKVNTAHKKVSKATDDQLDAAERKVNAAQTELWRVSERTSEVERKLLEHRAGVLGFSVSKMERKMTPSADASGLNTPNKSSAFYSVTTASPSPKARFDGAHLFAGHADAQIPKAPPSVDDIVTLENKLRAATGALSIANQKQAEMARELSHLRLEKEQIETTMGMELQTAEETVAALEQEFPRLEELNVKCQELLEERAQWEKDKILLAAREKEVERLERRLEVLEEQSGEATEMERALSDVQTKCDAELQTKDEEIAALKKEWEDAKEDWEAEKAMMEEDKLAELGALQDELEDAREEWEAERTVMEENKSTELGALQDELDDARVGSEARAELDEAIEALRTVMQLHGIQIFPDTSLQGLLASVASHLETLSAALQGHSDRHARLGDELQVHMAKNDTLSKDLDAVRLDRDNAQLEIQSLESRVKELIDASSIPTDPPVQYTGEVADIIAILQPIWNILPAPELRASKLNSKRHLRNPSMISNLSRSSPSPSPSKSTLSDMDVRALKSLYDVRSQPPPTPTSATSPPPPDQRKGTFSVEAFVSRVQTLVMDDRALIERLIRFAQAHDLLKKNAERAQKLAQDSNTALETYQRQVATLERQNASLVSKQNALMDEIRDLQDAIERAVCESREMEMHAADQAETCRQLTEANSSLSAKTLRLAEEAAVAPEKVRKQLEGQLAECTEALRKAREEVDGMRMSEQTQRIALLDELNSMQTENGNLRAQLRAKK